MSKKVIVCFIGLVMASVVGLTGCATFKFEAAIIEKDYTRAKELIDEGVDINKTFPDGATPLCAAVERSSDDIVKLLIEHGADANIVSSKCLTPLISAIFQGKLNLAKFLIDNGADINQKATAKKLFYDAIDFTPFHMACLYGYSDFAIYLFEKGVDTSFDPEFVEIYARMNHILGDYFLANDNREKSLEHFTVANDYYSKEWNFHSTTLDLIHAFTFGVGGAVMSTYGTLPQRTAFAVAMREAQKTNDNFTSNIEAEKVNYMDNVSNPSKRFIGYSKYEAKYGKKYIPTFTNITLYNAPAPPHGLPAYNFWQTFKFAQQKSLEILTANVLECYNQGLTEHALHNCIDDVTSKSKPLLVPRK